LVSPTADPGDVAPPAVLITFVALAGVLGILALLVLPYLARQLSRTSYPAGATAVLSAPRPGVAAVSCGVATLLFLGLMFPVAVSRHAAVIDRNWVLAAMVTAAILALTTGLVLRRWSTAWGWTDRHRLAVLTGPLIAHTLFGTAAVAHTFIDTVALTLLGIIMVVALMALDRRLQSRCSLSDLPIPHPRAVPGLDPPQAVRGTGTALPARRRQVLRDLLADAIMRTAGLRVGLHPLCRGHHPQRRLRGSSPGS
jgi:hypothetical protein